MPNVEEEIVYPVADEKLLETPEDPPMQIVEVCWSILSPRGMLWALSPSRSVGEEEEEGSANVLVKDIIHDLDQEEDKSEENHYEDQPKGGEDIEEIHPIIISAKTTVPI